jgi:cytochrome P450
MFRMLLGRVWSLLPQKRYLRVCKTTHDYIDYAIARALSGGDEHSVGDASIDEARKQPSMLGGLSIQTDDREFIRSQILQGMMASQETTSALLGNACFLLSRHAKYWQQIRLAVLERELHDFDFDTLLNFKLIQNVLLETLRLYPIFTLMGRAALQDTTLPVGGGPAQDEPMFVPKGAVAVMHYYALHRDPSVYGEDVETFRPERWETVHPSNWEFMGFGGGNRECLGRQKVLVEAAYVLVRLRRDSKCLRVEMSRIGWVS